MFKPRFKTLIEMLRFRALRNAQQPALMIEEEGFLYVDLWREINHFAGFLTRMGMKSGDRIVVVLPNGKDFFVSFYGIQLAGGIPIPLYHVSGAERIFSLSEFCDAKAVVTSSSLLTRLEESGSQGHRFSIISIDRYKSSPFQGDFPEISPDDIAFLQFTSGSTGNPKGVQLSHANIITNMEQMIAGMEITKSDIFVSWLPTCHDMGLILMTMVPFYLGASLYLLPTNLTSIRKWFNILSQKKATFTAAPDFGYRMALLYFRRTENIDLSNLRVALNAAEPVRTTTVYNFEKTFGIPTTMVPAYGLAEATVGVSSSPPKKPIKADQRGFVSVGKGFPGVRLKILRGRKFVGPGIIGEILVKSPANTKGYLKNPQENLKLFWRRDYIRTGDIGYYDAEGEFYIVGRKKNIIIQGGQNISPQEVEESIDRLPFVRLSAAIGIDRGLVEGEQVYVFAEVRTKESTPHAELEEMAIKIVRKFEVRLGFRPGRVYLVKPRSIPRTPNGKIMHNDLKRQYLGGNLRMTGGILFPDY